jgi:hypothetical protein
MHSGGTSGMSDCARGGVARTREDGQQDCETKDRLQLRVLEHPSSTRRRCSDTFDM